MPTPSITPSLSKLEWSAVAIALQDANSCGCGAGDVGPSRGLVDRLASALFDLRRPTGLADPKLEAVRRFVCATSRNRRPASDLVPTLADHGFSPAQIDALALLSI